MAETRRELNPDAFWRTVRERSAGALDSGALQPISTRAHVVTDRGIEFLVRVSDNLIRKPKSQQAYRQPRSRNPFLPPDPELTVGGVAPGHVAVLNKYNVLRDHVLVVTRGFAHQESPLTPGDFAAAAIGLRHGAGLAFYNAGTVAGASQPHKHLQLVPLPLADSSTGFPTASLLENAAEGIDTVAPLRFRHAFGRLHADPGDPGAFGRACNELYEHAVGGLGLGGPLGAGAEPLSPYNLVLTERWFLLVPRSTEHYRDISVNGLGYAGSLFVSTADRLEQVKAAGPMSLLEQVSTARR